MAEKEKRDVWVRVKDDAGNEFICNIKDLKSAKNLSEEQRQKCVRNIDSADE